MDRNMDDAVRAKASYFSIAAFLLLKWGCREHSVGDLGSMINIYQGQGQLRTGMHDQAWF
jgi:hypothetical protein